ncbi:MAG: tripartite tricarboxylate transporter substrate binding protein [Betaproteobacteria bacterium]|nr:MAG: tripartite tricarboxylate transporter substrate binding protein [Betaproteobacteria bacterium]
MPADTITLLTRATGLALAILLAPALAAAQTYPNKPIRIVSPGPAGGGTDVAARLIGQKLTEQWGQPVIVENRGGAGGTIGMEIVARSAPDGYSLVLVYGSFFIAPAVYSKLRYDSVKDFSPVIHLFNAPLMIAANPAVPARSVKELIALAKTKPGAITYSTPGVGSGSHLGGELLNSIAGIKLSHVPYKGTAPAVTDAIGGQVNLLITAVQNTVTHIRSGRLVPIGTTALKRTTVLPEVPAVAETLPGFEVISPYGILAPARTPRDIVAKLNSAVGALLSNAEFKKHFEQDGVEITGGSPEQFNERIRAYLLHYAKLVQLAGVKEE